MDRHKSLADAEVTRTPFTNLGPPAADLSPATVSAALVVAFAAHAEAEARAALANVIADLPGRDYADTRPPAARALRIAARDYARRSRIRGHTAAEMIVDIKGLLSPAVPITRRITLQGDLVSRVVSWCIESYYAE